MKIVFMGTPDFAVPTLNTLIQSRHQVIGVVTQPDKPKGRGGKMQYTPVKEAAVAAGIPVYQPQKVREESFLKQLKELAPDIIIVVAFGQILPAAMIHQPRHGCINVHASLLPKLRGAAPIQWSVIQGDEESGITIMQMDEGLDTGDILLVETYQLTKKETGGSLFDKLSVLGGPLVLQALDMAEQGNLNPRKQVEEEHTYARMLNKATGKMDFYRSAAELERLVRGLNPWPSAYTSIDGKIMKIWEAEVSSEHTPELPGTITGIAKDSITVQTGEQSLMIHSLQLEGKKRMDTGAFLRGYPLEEGSRLGE